MIENQVTAVLRTGSDAGALGLQWRGDDAGLAALRGEWNALLSRSASDTLFLTWEWVECWWRHFGRDSNLWIAELRDAGGSLRGIAPLKRRRRRGRLGTYRVVEFIGAGGPALPDHLDFIFERGWEAAGLEAVMKGLDARASEWELVILSELDDEPEDAAEDIPSDAPGGSPVDASASVHAPARAVAAWARSRRRWMHRYRSTVCPYLLFPETWEALVRGLRGGLKRNAPSQVRRVERRGGRLVAMESPADLDAGIRELSRLHQLRMEETDRGGNFRNPAYAAFHRDLMAIFASRGWLELQFLEVEGKNIAVEYGFRYKRKLYGYQLGFDPEWSSHSPGVVILAMRVRELIAEGFAELDMLRGRGAYKSNWTQRYREGITCIIPRRGARGVYAWLSELLTLSPPLLAKRLLPASLFESLVDARREKGAPRLSSRGKARPS